MLFGKFAVVCQKCLCKSVLNVCIRLDKNLDSACVLFKNRCDGFRALGRLGRSGFVLRKYAGCDGDTYRWQAPMGQELYVGLMNQEKKRTAIASALTQASGMQCRFEAIGAVKEKKADQSDESFLAALETTFGKANTMVQEDVKG